MNSAAVGPVGAGIDSGISISESEKQRLARCLWPVAASSRANSGTICDLDTFFKYLIEECSPRHGHATTVEQVIFIVDFLRDNARDSLAQLVNAMLTDQTRWASCSEEISETEIKHKIERVVRLWLMHEIRNVMPTHRQDLQMSLPWASASTLSSVLQVHISSHPEPQKGCFSEYLNVHDMRKIAGFRIEWTDNLAAHLVLQGTTIHLFHGVSVLHRMRQSPSTTVLVPLEYINEILATINLLVPIGSEACNLWLAEEVKRRDLDRNILHRDALDRDRARYRFWHERLATLEETFASRKPGTIFQWWHDTRDMHQWWTFWLVVVGIGLTVMFGLIQSITGILQVARPS